MVGLNLSRGPKPCGEIHARGLVLFLRYERTCREAMYTPSTTTTVRSVCAILRPQCHVSPFSRGWSSPPRSQPVLLKVDDAVRVSWLECWRQGGLRESGGDNGACRGPEPALQIKFVLERHPSLFRPAHRRARACVYHNNYILRL